MVCFRQQGEWRLGLGRSSSPTKVAEHVADGDSVDPSVERLRLAKLAHRAQDIDGDVLGHVGRLLPTVQDGGGRAQREP